MLFGMTGSKPRFVPVIGERNRAVKEETACLCHMNQLSFAKTRSASQGASGPLLTMLTLGC
jgi:hypothetical protein